MADLQKKCPLSIKNAPKIDYKNISLLKKYMTENSKIISSKITSIVLSAYNSGSINEQKLKNFIFNFKGHINIKKISKFEKAKLNF